MDEGKILLQICFVVLEVNWSRGMVLRCLPPWVWNPWIPGTGQSSDSVISPTSGHHFGIKKHLTSWEWWERTLGQPIGSGSYGSAQPSSSNPRASNWEDHPFAGVWRWKFWAKFPSGSFYFIAHNKEFIWTCDWKCGWKQLFAVAVELTVCRVRVSCSWLWLEIWKALRQDYSSE